jgi:predicted PurR-regulated permease PerM
MAEATRGSGWRTRDVLRVTSLVLGTIIALRFLWSVRSIACVAFLGVLFGLALGAGADRAARWRVPRGASVPLIVLLILGALVGVGALTAPRITSQLHEVREQVPEAIGRVERWVAKHQAGAMQLLQPDTTSTSAREQSPRPAVLREGIAQQAAKVGQSFFAFFSSTLAVLASLILILAISIYVGINPGLYHAGLMHLFPHRARAKAGEVLTEMATVLRKWLVVQLIAMVAIGIVTTIAMLVLGVKAPFALGFIAGLMEFIPTVGPLLAAVPAIAMGFVDSPEKALTVVLAYWAIQFLENNLLIPQLMRGGMDIPPALTLVAQALMTLVFGFIGLMVAVPLTAAVLVPIKMLYVRDTIGDDVDLMSNGDDEDDE